MNASGFFEAVLREVFSAPPDNLVEDWDKRRITFSVGSPIGSFALSISQEKLDRLQAALGTSRFMIITKPNTDFAAEQEYGVVLEITIPNVTFPARPK